LSPSTRARFIYAADEVHLYTLLTTYTGGWLSNARARRRRYLGETNEKNENRRRIKQVCVCIRDVVKGRRPRQTRRHFLSPSPENGERPATAVADSTAVMFVRVRYRCEIGHALSVDGIRVAEVTACKVAVESALFCSIEINLGVRRVLIR